MKWAGDSERRRLTFNNRAKEALSLLLVAAEDGDRDGTPVAAEKFFDQMEIYPGKCASSLRPIDNNVKQGPRRRISASCTKRQEYPTLKWSVRRMFLLQT